LNRGTAERRRYVSFSQPGLFVAQVALGREQVKTMSLHWASESLRAKHRSSTASGCGSRQDAGFRRCSAAHSAEETPVKKLATPKVV
jgi:hypothetical protein